MITLRVDGEPAPQGSKSVGRHGGVYEKSKKVKPWRDAIRAAALGTCLSYEEQALVVEITFWLARPKGHYRTGRNAHLLKEGAPAFPATRPDLDKLIRSTLDGLKAGGLYGDDGQVVQVTAVKLYCTGNEPGARIYMRPWGED